MIRPRQVLRLIHINRILIRHQLDELVLAAGLLRPFSLLLYLAPWHWLRRDRDLAPRAIRLRQALEDLGPIFVKFGQMLSTRRDLLPPDIVHELGKLRDQVPPFPGSVACSIIERAYGCKVSEAFARFEEIPFASASIAQVHGACLKDGREVVVKVLRPGIEATIRNDLDLMYLTGTIAERYWPEARRLHPREVVADYEKTTLAELDLAREAANAAQLRHNFAGSDEIYIPEVEWSLTRREVMVMERISGIPVNDIAALKARGTDMKLLAERGVNIFFVQVFKHNFFHADMHAGNIFIDARDPTDPRYIAIDFGIVGSLSPGDQNYLAQNMVAFFNRDYRRVAELHVQSGWVPKGTRVQELESAIRTVCEPIFDRPLKDISLGQLLLRLFQTARRFEMEVQPQLVLLEKTLLNIEGLGRELYPDLDLWETAKPTMEEWVREQMGIGSFIRDMKNDFPMMLQTLKELPIHLHEASRMAVNGDLDLGRLFKSPEFLELKDRITMIERRLFGVATGAAFVLGGVLLLGLGFHPIWLGGGILGFGILTLLGGWLIS